MVFDYQTEFKKKRVLSIFKSFSCKESNRYYLLVKSNFEHNLKSKFLFLFFSHIKWNSISKVFQPYKQNELNGFIIQKGFYFLLPDYLRDKSNNNIHNTIFCINKYYISLNEHKR